MIKRMGWARSQVLQAAMGLLLSTSALALTPGTITTFAGNGVSGTSGDGGPATSAQLNVPAAVAVDGHGNVYIADSFTAGIRKVSSSGTITTFAGNGSTGYSGDGGAATSASLGLLVLALAVDANGNVVIADFTNNRIRKVDTNGIITTIAGNGQHGYSGDGGAATNAKIGNVYGMAFDSSGNLFLSDETYHVIRKIDTSGVITTVAGTGVDGNAGDGGQASSAKIGQPYGLAFDASGNLYIADAEYSVVRKIDTSGVITTAAGGGAGGDGSQASAASLATTYSVTFDGAGNMYIVTGNVVREVNTSGIISTFAGTGAAGYSGDNGPATSAEFNNPFGIASDAAGDIYIADMLNNVVRRVQGPVTAASNIFDAAGTLAYTTAVAYNPGLTPVAAPSGVVPNQLAIGSDNIGIADNGVLVVQADPGAQTVDLSTSAPGNMLLSLPVGVTVPLQYGSRLIQATGSAGVGSTSIPTVLATGTSTSQGRTTGLTLLAGEVQLGVQSGGSIGSMLWGQSQNQRGASISATAAATADMVRFADGSGALAALNGNLTVQLSASSTQAAQSITLLAGEVVKFNGAGQITGTYLGS
ncbi:MAG: hypothetical protein JO218_09610, partial [Burkholderiales bacterium]|nr:hypothetical protein [Burkholderiales bacterium]